MTGARNEMVFLGRNRCADRRSSDGRSYRADRRLMDRGSVLALGVAVLLKKKASLRMEAQTDVGDAGAPANNAYTSSGYTITGTVMNSVTGEPVRHALVQVANLPGNPPSKIGRAS